MSGRVHANVTTGESAFGIDKMIISTFLQAIVSFFDTDKLLCRISKVVGFNE